MNDIGIDIEAGQPLTAMCIRIDADPPIEDQWPAVGLRRVSADDALSRTMWTY